MRELHDLVGYRADADREGVGAVVVAISIAGYLAAGLLLGRLTSWWIHQGGGIVDPFLIGAVILCWPATLAAALVYGTLWGLARLATRGQPWS